jgi:PAS domain S-box-containing protein
MTVDISSDKTAHQDFLLGGGEIAEFIRRADWSATALGPIETWPQSLRTTVSLCLASNFPINIIWGPDHLQIYNEGYRVVCGDAHPRALGESYRVTWASAWPAIGEPFERALAGETSYLENQRMFLTRNGYLEETFFTFSLSPIRDESGGIGGLFHPVTETTATMLAERRTRALRDLNAQLATATDFNELVECTSSMLGTYDLDLPFGLFYEWVESDGVYCLKDLYGLAADTVASPRVIKPDVHSLWPTRAVLTGGIREVYDLQTLLQGIACGPYEESPQRAFVIPVKVPGIEKPPLIVVLGVSSRLPVDAAYRAFYEFIGAALNGALSTVRAREDERRRAEALAELDRAKTAFFSNVSHEFRTPLTLMLGPLEDSLAHAEHLSTQERERLELAHRNARRLLKLVNTLLDFSRIEAGRLQATHEPTDLAALTADLASNFRSATERAGLALVIEASPLPFPVNVDRDMWEKIVLNLLSNAFKFTFHGEIRVSVGLTPDGQRALVTFTDTGTGIPAAELPRLFERFRRVSGAKGRSFEGSGIGLALVQELVHLQGGEVRVESEIGKGTTFEITLPFASADATAPIAETGPSDSGATRAQIYVEEALRWLPDSGVVTARDERPQLDDQPIVAVGRVLLADDNADMRGYVQRLLQAEGFLVTSVADGEAALAAARAYPPDLIISDVMMPRLDGFGLLAEVRADPTIASTPFLLLSARAGEEARVEGLEAGADDYLIKPFSARELATRVRATLSLARDRREALLRRSQEQQTLKLTLLASQHATSNPDAVMLATAEALGLYLGASSVGFFELANESNEEGTVLFSDGWSEQQPIPKRSLPISALDQSMLIALRSGTVVAGDLLALDSVLAGRKPDHAVVVPIIRHDHLVAGLYMQQIQPELWTDDDESLVREVADFTWDAVELARALISIQESEARFRTMADAVPQMVWITDAEGRIEFFNKQWAAYTGATDDPATAKQAAAEFIHPDDGEATLEAWDRARNTGTTFSTEHRVRSASGSYQWFLVRAEPYRDPTTGKVIRWFGSSTDIHDRKWAEQRLTELNETLEARVAQRTDELSQAQRALRHAQKMEAMGQLTGGVAHDFNNLLMPILGSLDLLQQRRIGSEREQRMISGAIESAERARTVVQRLLAFARRQPLLIAAVDVARLITGMLDLLSSSTGPQVKVVLDISPDVPPAHADAHQLEMALLNLSVNACDAMPHGGTLNIAATECSIDANNQMNLRCGHYVCLSVSDTGVGMDEATIARAIEPFFSTKGIGKGTGLGLSMVHGLALQLGGALRLSSTPNVGTNVELWLPVSEQRVVAHDARPTNRETQRLAAGMALVVDDEDLVRASTADMLIDLGYSVIEANCAASALKLVDEGLQPDVLITDHLMPGMTGTELARKLKARRPQMPVVIVSGFAEVESIAFDLPRLAKPYRNAELAAILASLTAAVD